MKPPNPLFSRRTVLAGGAALGLAACGGPARGRDPLKSIQQGLAAAPLPPPWEPLVVSGTAVETAGHRYRFDAGPFPSSLEIDGAEFLFDGVKLDVRVQDELLVWQRARTVSLSATDVELLARGNAGDLIAQTRVSISYDGMCRFRVSLIPQGLITIDSILLDVPILRSETTHYAHHLLGVDASEYAWLDLFGEPQAIWGGGRVPDNGWSGEATPYFWAGNPERGLVWFTDQIAIGLRQEAIAQLQLRPVEGAMRLLVELIARPLDMPDTMHLDFGFHPTPATPPMSRKRVVKPAPVAWRPDDRRMVAQLPVRTSVDTRATLASLRDQGAEAIVLAAEWSDIPGLPHFASEENERAFRDMVDATHDVGLKVIPTISADSISVRVPGAAELVGDMPLPITPRIANLPPPPVDIVPLLFHTEASAAFYEETIRAFATEFPIDGVSVRIGEPSARMLALQSERQPGARAMLDLHSRRDLLRRLYALFHGGLRERDEDGIVMVHSPMPWSMIHGFADLLVTGHNVYKSVVIRQASDEGLAARWQPGQLPYLYGHVTHGLPTLFQIPAADSDHLSRLGTFTREDLTTGQELFALAAVYNASIWQEDLRPSPALESLARLEELRMRLGFGDATWHPYWQREQRLIVQPPSTFFSHWLKDSGEMLLLLLNGAKNEQDILVELADGGSRLAAEDVWNGAPVRTRENLIITTLGPSRFAALHVRQG